MATTIPDARRGQLLKLLQSPEWGTFADLKTEIEHELGSQSLLQDTEFNTIKEAARRQYMVEGMNELIGRAIRLAGKQ